MQPTLLSAAAARVPALLCVLSVAAALVMPFATFELAFSAAALAAVFALALPFVVLAVAVFTTAHWLAHIVLGPLALLTWIPWVLSVGVMAWFKPGLPGAAVLGMAMALVDAALAWIVHRAAQRWWVHETPGSGLAFCLFKTPDARHRCQDAAQTNRKTSMMNLGELQAELRHFAAERDWQPFQTPKNLAMALIVEAAELTEIFQWLTPEESQRAHETSATRQHIGEEVADVLLYLLQLADHCRIDIAQAVRDKLGRNALKYPAKRTLPRVAPERAEVGGTHVLLDYENVQPTEAELRALVPEAAQVWVFHGPQQRHVAQRFASFGTAATPVPISKTGKNALDFHLSFYMGYIASRNAESTMVVVANDKGYEPMLEHARAMGFSVRRQAYEAVKAEAKKAPAKRAAAKKAPAKKVATKKAAAKKAATSKARPMETAAAQPPAKPTAAKKAAAKKASSSAAPKKAPVARKAPAKQATPKAAPAAPRQPPMNVPAVDAPAASAAPTAPSAADVSKVAQNLRTTRTRPTKPAALRRLLKSFGAPKVWSDAYVQALLDQLTAAAIVSIGARNNVTYPQFDTAPSASP